MIESPRHQLDEAIDRVAAKLVAAPGDDRVLQTVIARLPDRESRSWFLKMPVQATAAAALVLMAFLWARPSEPPALPIALAPIAASAPPVITARMVEPASLRPVIRIPDPGPRIPAGASDRPDHEFSLPPVAALEAIELGALTTPAFAPVAMEALAPLVLTDLPLASDSSSRHEQ